MRIIRRPNRLHHTAYVTKDLEATRAFYEDVIGLPLIATYTEMDELFGKDAHLLPRAFSNWPMARRWPSSSSPNADDQAEFGRISRPAPSSTSLCTSTRIPRPSWRRASPPPASPSPQTYVLEHGYCRSVYVTDPNGMILEFTYDTPAAMAPDVDAERRATAKAELARWLAGDHRNNNPYRHAA
jgi:glyoxylase I family protein